MPQELPGFYYDPEKNRYFPVKGPIPGSYHKSAPPPQKSSQPLTQGRSHPKTDLAKLLHRRELCGSIINISSRKESFEEESRKNLASKLKVWRYQDAAMDADSSISKLDINVQTLEGQFRTDALLTGGVNGSLSLFDVGNVGKHFSHGAEANADFVWPESSEADCSGTLKDIWRFNRASIGLDSTISCISVPRKRYFHGDSVGAEPKYALITTIGSELSSGSLHILDLANPVNIYTTLPYIGRLHQVGSLNCTVWGADSNYSGSRAIVGTNLGASLVDLETSVTSMLCRSKSDVLSVQLIHSFGNGNIALCGLRNGAIVTVDVRQRQRELPRHRIPYPSPDSTSSRTAQRAAKSWFMFRGNIQPSCTVYMPSSVCCLESLQTYDQCFLASSLDGSIRLYDHRLTNRGPVQSYQGHVNSHHHIDLGTDTSERFVMSGGEDCKMRIWSIKSGEMLFEEKLSECIPLTVSWRGGRGILETIGERQISNDHDYRHTHNGDAWVGSEKGLLRIQFSV